MLKVGVVRESSRDGGGVRDQGAGGAEMTSEGMNEKTNDSQQDERPKTENSKQHPDLLTQPFALV